jgi:hypothetical protein
MQFAQLNEDGTYFKQCESGNILWDENNFCTAEALYKDGRADMFRVVPLLETPAPEYDPMTQELVRDGAELVAGQWQYKWRVDALSPAQIAENIEAKNRSIRQEITTSTQQRLDEFAQTRGYDGVLSLCTYATSANPKFRQEGLYGVEARDATWAKLYEILAEVEAGARPVPSGYAEIEPELPALVWPE